MSWDAWALLSIIALCTTVIARTCWDSYRLDHAQDRFQPPDRKTVRPRSSRHDPFRPHSLELDPIGPYSSGRDSVRSQSPGHGTFRLPLATGGHLEIPCPPGHPTGRHRLHPAGWSR